MSLITIEELILLVYLYKTILNQNKCRLNSVQQIIIIVIKFTQQFFHF